MNPFSLKNLYCLLAVLCSYPALAATDTAYYDAQHRKLHYYKNAHYFIVSEKTPGDNYQVNSYSYPAGLKQMTGFISDMNTLAKHGMFTYYHDNGSIASSGKYKEGMKEGEWNYYREDDAKNIWYAAYFRSDVYHGKFNSFYRSGKPKREEVYENGTMVSGKRYSEEGAELPFAPFYVPEEPKVDMLKYLGGHIVYPDDCKRKFITGRVLVKFVVSKTGEIENVGVIQRVHPQMDHEAVRVVKAMPSWKPATRDDEPVSTYFELPINFDLY